MTARKKRYKHTTAKQVGGDDGYCWAVFLNGRAMVTGLTRSEVAYYRDIYEAQGGATTAAKPLRVSSIADLRSKAWDARYLKLALRASANLGGPSTGLAEALRWLEINAMETGDEDGGGEAGVVEEINSLAKLIGAEL